MRETISRSVAGSRRAWRKRRRALVRQAAQARALVNDLAMNVYAAHSRERNSVTLAYRANDILADAKRYKERIVRAQLAYARRMENALAVSLLASFALLAWAAWRAF